MKVPKKLVRNPDGTKTLERPYRIAIDDDGQPQRVYAGQHEDGMGRIVLPRGWRWAHEGDAHHDEVAEGIAHRAWNASKR